MKILVTGATGNVGKKVIEILSEHSDIYLFAGVRNISSAQKILDGIKCNFTQLDFEAFLYPTEKFDAVFLVRPPQLADPELFKKFMIQLDRNTKVVFLSVQGADVKSYLPHAKIEKEILKLELEHTFLRPSYFMENLATNIWDEIKRNKRIFLPSGDLKFNWIALADVAVKALVTKDFVKTVDISNTEFHSFPEIVSLINEIAGTTLKYESPSLLRYLFYSLKTGHKIGYILVMLLLHYLPKFQKSAPVTSEYEKIMYKANLSVKLQLQNILNLIFLPKFKEKSFGY